MRMYGIIIPKIMKFNAFYLNLCEIESDSAFTRNAGCTI